MTPVLIAVGLVLLVIGGEALVRGAVGIAERFRVSPLVIGLTLVGFGTSMPELVTSIQAALVDAPGIAVGNVVGSNIANILLILGIAALIRPIAASPSAFRRDGSLLLVATLAGVAIVLAGTLTRGVAAVLIACLAGYVAATYLLERRSGSASAALHLAEAEAVPPAPKGLGRALPLLAGGLVLTILGARLLVDGAIDLARLAGISEAAIGLTIVAVGTSLPELVTSAVAARRGQSDVALGNVIGSNIFNILGILGATALVTPITVPAEIARFDIWVMLAATAALFGAAMTGRGISRPEGALLLLGYAAYLVTLFLVAPAS